MKDNHEMHEPDVYEHWRRARASADEPEGFTDRVMTAVEQHEQRRGMVLLALLRRVATSRSGRAAIWSLALAACMARAAVPMAILLIP